MNLRSVGRTILHLVMLQTWESNSYWIKRYALLKFDGISTANHWLLVAVGLDETEKRSYKVVKRLIQDCWLGYSIGGRGALEV